MSSPDPDVLRVVRVDELLENVAGSEEIAGMVIDEFLQHVEPQMSELRVAVGKSDLSRLASTAHRFKGSLAAISATTATLTAGALERAALRGDREGASRELADLGPRVEELVATLRSWRQRGTAQTPRGGDRHG